MSSSDDLSGNSNGTNRFKVLTVDYSYDNPVVMREMMENGEVDHVPDQLPDYRKLSVISNSMYQKGTRRPSRDMGIQVSNTSILPELFPTSMYEDPQWYQMTQDAVPRMEHYRRSTSVGKNLVRPTLEELHNPKPNRQNDKSRKISVMENGHEEGQSSGAVKFGWIRGVYIRCLLNIWGVMLFLRMGWMVGQAGMGYSILIVVIATVITIVTTLSMSAICTNGEVKGGGVYYMISRSLGPEFGGAIGMIFFVANSVAVSMYIVGAAETVKDLLLRYEVGIVEYPSDINDVRISGIILLVLVVCVTGIGMAFENKAQLILLVLLLAAMVDYFVGACLPPTVEQVAKGFVGWNMEVAERNLHGEFRGDGFFDVFSIFFPSVIGILAGANISGDLKDPSSAIPKGTILAILTTSISYILIIIWLGCTLLRDASGDLEVANATFQDMDNVESIYKLANCTGKCPHGMLNYNPVMEMSSAWGPLIFVGIFAATLSSALAALVSAPRIFQALCKDKIFPKLQLFAKGYGPNDDPRRATGVVFVIAFLCTCIGELDAIAPVISNFFMCSYCLVNFSCFHATFVKSPGFRPAFRYYNQWLSLVGSIVCLTVMFIMSWIIALVTLAIVLAFYIYINRNQPDVNWGSSTQGFIYKNALSAVTKLSTVEDHVKNYRPAIIVLTGNASSRPPLVDLAHTITKNLGLMVCGHIIKNTLSPGLRKAMIDHNVSWLENRKVKAFYSLFHSDSLDGGIRAQLELVGLGKMRPNILLMGFKTGWAKSTPKALDEYFNAIHAAFDLHLSVVILRVKEGLDYKRHLETEQEIPYSDAPNSIPKSKKTNDLEEPVKVMRKPPIKEDSSDSDSETASNEDQKNSIHLEVMPYRKVSRVVPDINAKMALFRRLSTVDVSKLGVEEIPQNVINSLNIFQQKQKGFIDVWWLYDDGGLTMLIPYLLTTRTLWKNCQLRVFCIAHKKHALDQAQINVQSLLKKFRIDFSAVTIVPDVATEPKDESKRKFQKLISKWVSDHEGEKGIHTITKTDLSAHKERTTRNIRLRELLDQHSTDNASLIIMTLPMPRKKSCPPPLYMAWLEMLTSDMPPFLLVRGNQESVLTYYS